MRIIRMKKFNKNNEGNLVFDDNKIFSYYPTTSRKKWHEVKYLGGHRDKFSMNLMIHLLESYNIAISTVIL